MRYETRDEVERIGQAGATYDGHKARYLSSFWLHLEPNDSAFTVHYATGYWESWVTAWISRQFDSHDMFFDVGANVGYYTFMASAAGIETHAFEPQKSVYELLELSKKENRSPATLHNVALSDSPGTVELVIPLSHSGAGHFHTDDDKDYEFVIESVRAERFDDLFGEVEGKRLLFKVDAEGAEPLIWAGMEKALSKNEVTAAIEYSASRDKDGRFAASLLKHSVKVIDKAGGEQEVNADSLRAMTDIEMLVVRNH